MFHKINTTQKIKDWATRTPHNIGDELYCSGKPASFCFSKGSHRVTLVRNPVISQEWGNEISTFYYYHCVDTSAGGLLVTKTIIIPLVIACHWHGLVDVFMF